jgi:hypothetical protein
VDDGVLCIDEVEPQRRFDHISVDGGDGEQVEQLAQELLRLLAAHGFRGYIRDGRDRRRAHSPVDPLVVDQREEPSRDAGVRLLREQHVEDDVGVEQHLHRCLSSRCRR